MSLDFAQVEFIVTILMTVLFGLVILTGIVYFLKTFIGGALFHSVQNFYITILLYAICRVTYFAFKIYFYVGKTNDNMLQRIAISIYHLGSTFFYIAFVFLIIYWGEHKISSSVMSEAAASKSLRIFKILFYVLIVVIQLLQIVLFVTRLLVEIPPTPSPIVDVVDVVQLIYHCALCWTIVSLFIGFIIFSLRQEWVGFRPNEDRSYKNKMLTFVVSVLCLIIFIKGFLNLALSILESLVIIATTHYIATIIYSISSVLFDVLPSVIVIFSISSVSEKKPRHSLKFQKV
jgi:hypothetical protein